MLTSLFIVFVFGLIFGSFLNVVICRLPLGRGVVKGHSHCPECGKILKWRELIPVLSFFLLRGKCSGCEAKISWQYPAVEIISGLIWVLVFYKSFGFWDLSGFARSREAREFVSDFGFRILDFAYQVFILSSLAVISFIDAKKMIIPDKIIYPAIAVSLFYDFGRSLAFGNWQVYLIEPILTAALLFLFFFSLFYFSKGRAMGMGDAKFGVLIGLFLGPAQALVGLFLAFVLGALFGIILIVLGRKKFGSALAFGPFLSLGALTAYLIPAQVFLGFIEELMTRFY